MAAATPPVQAELVVVVSAKNPLPSLRSEQVADIFLGKSSTFPGNGPALPLDLPDGSAPREEFYAKVANKSPAVLKSYWSKLIFTGEAYPPKEISGMAGVKKMIAEHPSYIGYIDRSMVDASVKVVLVLR